MSPWGHLWCWCVDMSRTNHRNLAAIRVTLHRVKWCSAAAARHAVITLVLSLGQQWGAGDGGQVRGRSRAGNTSLCATEIPPDTSRHIRTTREIWAEVTPAPVSLTMARVNQHV